MTILVYYLHVYLIPNYILDKISKASKIVVAIVEWHIPC